MTDANRFLLATGLFLLTCSFIFAHFRMYTDLADGFLKGVGITLVLFSVLRKGGKNTPGQK